MRIAKNLPPINPATTPARKSREKLLDAALHIIRTKGYASTTVDDICLQAGVTKGSFFHHFKSKDDLALAAVAHWKTLTEGFFAAAPYHLPTDPLVRLIGYLDCRAAMLTGELPDYTCLLGTLVQETYDTHPHIRAACEQALAAHVAALARDVDAAKQLYAPNAPWTPEGVGNFIQAVLQGSFIFAKAKQSPQAIRESLDHLRVYLRVLFSPDGPPHAAEPIPESNPTEEEADHDRDQSHYVD
jgi:TetR/AcrR family transcriptional repressor of nem operon